MPTSLFAVPAYAPRHWHRIGIYVLAAVLAACTSTPRQPNSSPSATSANVKSGSGNSASLPAAGSGRGGYYLDDGPGQTPPDGLLDIPNPIPKVEPYASTGNKPYVVFGTTYTPLVDQHPFKQRGIGSWYGKKFHGQKTSSGERYDMYKLTGAHPTLPIPSYARVTNVSNGAQVIVRINDRGPFHSSRIIDLSYTAALKLGYINKGSAELEVERLLPEEIERIAAGKAPLLTTAPVTTVATVVTVVPPPTQQTVPIAVVSPPPDNPPVQREPLSTIPPVADMVAVSAGSDALNVDHTQHASGFYLQFGAFSSSDKAEVERIRLTQNWDNSLPMPEIISAGNVYRLHSGPFASREEAVSAGLKVQVNGEAKPLVVQRSM